MSSTNKTTYYELPQFVDDDIFNPLVDDNDAYQKIDTALHNIAEAEADDSSEIVGVKSRMTTVEGKVETLETQNGDEALTTTAQTLSGAVNELDSDVASLDGRVDVVEDDINNENTGLKVKVNSLGTRMTTAEGDIDALETQNGNSVLKTVAQTLSGAINENFDKIKAYEKITTPEMYGAVGDGVTDDSVAIQNAIDNGNMCIANGTYITTVPISIGGTKKLILNGSIHYTGADTALIIGGRAYVEGGTIRTDGIHAIKNDVTTPLNRATVKDLTLNCYGSDAIDSLIYLFSDSSSNCCVFNKFDHIYCDGRDGETIKANAGIELHTDGTGYINENYFENMIYGADYGIKMIAESSSKFDWNRFLKNDTESCAHALKCLRVNSGFENNVFDFRTQEIDDKLDQIDIEFAEGGSGGFRFNTFYGQYRPQMFKLTGNSPDTVYSASSPEYNRIIGDVHLNSGRYTHVNPSFLVRGSKIMFNFTDCYNPSANIASGILTDGVLKLDYSGDTRTSVGLLLVLNSRLTDITIDLDGIVSYCTTPHFKVFVGNSDGTNISFIDSPSGSTLRSLTAVPYGVHTFEWTATDAIRLVA